MIINNDKEREREGDRETFHREDYDDFLCLQKKVIESK